MKLKIKKVCKVLTLPRINSGDSLATDVFTTTTLALKGSTTSQPKLYKSCAFGTTLKILRTARLGCATSYLYCQCSQNLRPTSSIAPKACATHNPYIPSLKKGVLRIFFIKKSSTLNLQSN